MSKHELTARIAYEIYLQRGRQPGRSREDWVAAEAVVALCLAFAATLLESTDSEAVPASAETPEIETPEIETPEVGSTAPVFSAQERAFALLCTAAQELGRAELAKTLGYKSTSSVGPYLRGKRPIGAKLAERILANLGPATQAPRRAA